MPTPPSYWVRQLREDCSLAARPQCLYLAKLDVLQPNAYGSHVLFMLGVWTLGAEIAGLLTDSFQIFLNFKKHRRMALYVFSAPFFSAMLFWLLLLNIAPLERYLKCWTSLSVILTGFVPLCGSCLKPVLFSHVNKGRVGLGSIISPAQASKALFFAKVTATV